MIKTDIHLIINLIISKIIINKRKIILNFLKLF